MKIVVVKECVISRDEGRKTISTLTAFVKPSDPRECKDLIPQGYFRGIGIAKCLEGDIFDEERGKRIALAKAENDAYDKASNYLCEYLDEMSKLTMLIFNFIEKAGRHEAHNLDYIESIHNPEHSMYKEIVTKIKSGTTNGKPNCELEDDIKIIPCSANLNI